MKAYLLLQDGTVFEGNALGKTGTIIGEIVFNTGMTGYQEVLTDSSYYGQIVTMTYPLIGNYGVNEIDMECSKSHARGFIVREACSEPSNFRCSGNFNDFLIKQNVIALEGIDTRALTKILRESGVMNGAITNSFDNKEKLLKEIKNYVIKDAVASVSVKQPEEYKAENAKYKVCLMDYGYKQNIMRSLQKRGCDVVVMPYDAKIEDVKKYNPDGIMLSNGPGDPSENKEIIKELKNFYESGIPTFGICLGHQLMALAMGGKTEKLKYGHRGANHPVKDLIKDRTYITSQNHGYAVIAESIDKNIGEVTHISMNDSTLEGIKYKSGKVFTVQFHPEASPGPQDTPYLFDEFIELMAKNKK